MPERDGEMPEESLDKSYLDHKYFIDSNVYNCPFCNRRNVIYSLTNHLEFDWDTEKKCHVHIARCSSCRRQSMHLSFDSISSSGRTTSGYVYWMFVSDIGDIDSRIFYSVPTSFFTIDKRVPKIIRELITEAEGSLKMNYLTGASACVRKAIYELLVCEKFAEGAYKDRIKSLKDKYPGTDPELFDVLGHIQQMTSDKIHEQSWDKWNAPTLRLIIETVKEVLYEIYVLPGERKQRKNAIQQLRHQALVKPGQSQRGG